MRYYRKESVYQKIEIFKINIIFAHILIKTQTQTCYSLFLLLIVNFAFHPCLLKPQTSNFVSVLFFLLELKR